MLDFAKLYDTDNSLPWLCYFFSIKTRFYECDQEWSIKPCKVSGTKLAFHYRGYGYGLQSLIPDDDTHVSRKLQYFAFSEYNIYLCLVDLQSKNSSLNCCQLKRRKGGTTAWKTQSLLTEWIQSCLFDIQRGISSRWDHEWQNLEHSRIIDRTVLVKRPEWDISVYYTKKSAAGTGRGWTEASKELTQSLLMYYKDPMTRVNMHVNIIENKLSSTMNPKP